jgi:two-component system, chemotaxis family, chemotaxis protein CheY
MGHLVGAPYKILVVDDSAMMRELVFAAVSRMGNVDLVEAADGMEALQVVTNGWRPELVITDINMPVIDGLGLIERLRAHPEVSAVPIIVITTELATEERDKALALGANSYVTKPIQARAMIDAIKALLPAR